jgi:hypothetical protein
MIKASKKGGIEKMSFNIVKAIYDKPLANIILNVTETISSKVRNKTRVSTLNALIQYSMELSATAIKLEKEIEEIQIGII